MAHIADLLSAGRTYSFEFSPPGTEAGWLTLGRTISELDSLRPSFVSVTYGAGGGTRVRTHEAVAWIRKETPVTPMAHLTCVSHTRSDIGEILDAYDAVEVENILALAGDPPSDPANARPSDYRYALELVEHVREHTAGFSIGVAAHPEIHPRSESDTADRDHLAAKLGIADFAITQFFFEADSYLRLVDDLAARGTDKPVIPGIMPITNIASVARMAQLSGAAIPTWLTDRLDAVADDPDAVRAVGVDTATSLCAALLEAGAPGLHFYTLNRSTATREIYANLGLAP
jgi:methylenetetrahydrofolate reductase (NADPH)